MGVISEYCYVMRISCGMSHCFMLCYVMLHYPGWCVVRIMWWYGLRMRYVAYAIMRCGVVIMCCGVVIINSSIIFSVIYSYFR